MKYLVDAMALSVFFEGGTYKGATALRASQLVDKVFTVERSETMFGIARSTIGNVENIAMLQGDTRDHLPAILEANDNILFWLDAHWSGDETYGEGDECPLLPELEIIFGYGRNCAILIDDARLFLAPPPKPHEPEHWPTIKDILEAVPRDWDLVVYEDVIYLIPGRVSAAFREFVQAEVTEKWRAGAKKASWAGKIRSAFLSMEKLLARGTSKETRTDVVIK